MYVELSLHPMISEDFDPDAVLEVCERLVDVESPITTESIYKLGMNVVLLTAYDEETISRDDVKKGDIYKTVVPEVNTHNWTRTEAVFVEFKDFAVWVDYLPPNLDLPEGAVIIVFFRDNLCNELRLIPGRNGVRSYSRSFSEADYENDDLLKPETLNSQQLRFLADIIWGGYLKSAKDDYPEELAA